MSNGIVEFAGAAGTGKTQVAMWLIARAMARDDESSVIYVGTEGEFPLKRFKQMCSVSQSRRLVLEKVDSFEALQEWLQTRFPILANKTKARLLVIDSVGALRSDFGDAETPQRAQALWNLGYALKWIVDTHSCGVIVTNQVVSVMDGVADQVRPALGMVWSSIVNTRVLLSRSKIPHDDGVTIVRNMHIDCCPYLPKMTLPFIITTAGIEGLSV